MVFVSVTRLHIRSLFFMLQFGWYTLRSQRQAARAKGFLAGRVMREPRNIFWTLTAWESDQAMNAYRTSGAHRRAMPKLLNWCDEAALVHWVQDTAELPSWQKAYERLIKEGRPSKVNHPSASHAEHHIPAPNPRGIDVVLHAPSH